MSGTCLMCKGAFEDGNLPEELRNKPGLCPACLDKHDAALQRQSKAGALTVAALGVGALALLLALVAIVLCSSVAGRQRDLRSQEAVFRQLLAQNDAGRSFQIVKTLADGELTGTVVLRGLSADDLDRMIESNRTDLLKTQHFVWEEALKSGYGSAPVKNRLDVMVVKSAGQPGDTCYGSFVGGKWNAK